ncbi:hypothetical protein BN12_220022 [Nostocoides japonicum T1-X7]|uniref:Uncharacterized protein n=1 Tax=Nostocoides japonicum T1-X7 TaxID=1194083 RepID=A0A077M0N0_9MICO|nr:hypothetical protein BN12_220022 [Tetrasphaera japonica T1-X7]
MTRTDSPLVIVLLCHQAGRQNLPRMPDAVVFVSRAVLQRDDTAAWHVPGVLSILASLAA